MTAMSAYRRLSPVLALALLALLIAAVVAPARAADAIQVAIDQATIAKMPENVATLVIGNPLIADVTVEPGGLLIVTGKSYGATNLIALDRSGAVLIERNIEVAGPRDEVVWVYRGVARETLSCAPDCEPRIMLGDNPGFFGETMSQSGNRTSRARGEAGNNGSR